ncbi:epidermal growth factor receptor isoform X1 [Oopsacas minuta]|uniref:Tyrosine-protein kinase n=1 Tax=Oopsacas minuta TaxID=111878 RepID=A0AAV7JTZ2_9METZ|nr:epidermal growth factor receptor isoform X1 [Oopsacas minuta]
MAKEIQVLKTGTECIAKYDFEGTSNYDLPFKKGDWLVIVKTTRDPNWYVAEKFCDGKKGMIPVNYVKENSKKAVKLQTMPWFHGKITREVAESLLNPISDGLFLVRESTNYPGDYTLCVAFDAKVEHYRVIHTNSKVTVDEEEFFDSLTELVAHYESDADGLCIQLLKCVPKDGVKEFEVKLSDFEQAGWLIKKRDLEFHEVLGDGEFGEVRKGIYRGIKVAIKTLKPETCTKFSIQNFLAEASVMTDLKHPNLVRLMGINIDETVKPSRICLITEFMSKGSLIEYLRTRGRAVITRQNQFSFACDVGKGMAYLENRDLVHRDLAARNVLVAEDNVAKVADFGLARPELFKSDSVGKIPIKWTAPEALRRQDFSSKSDVWSYGVFLWELYSFGRVPYPRVPLNDVTKFVEMGNRMDIPDKCPVPIYQLMIDCWQAIPSSRPKFESILQSLKAMQFEACTPATMP